MKIRVQPKRRAKSGMSLLEAVLASTIFAGIGYVLLLSMRVSDSSKSTVESIAVGNASVRATASTMRDELRAANANSINVTTTAGGFARISMQTAIQSPSGGIAWGAYERGLDLDEANCHREGWTVEYVAEGGQGSTPPLERRILDQSGAIQHTRTLASAVSQFSVAEVGDVWVVEMTTLTPEGTRHEEFDVRTRDR